MLGPTGLGEAVQQHDVQVVGADLFPKAVEIRLLIQGSDSARPVRVGREPAELFREYLQSAGVEDRRLEALFDELLDLGLELGLRRRGQQPTSGEGLGEAVHRGAHNRYLQKSLLAVSDSIIDARPYAFDDDDLEHLRGLIAAKPDMTLAELAEAMGEVARTAPEELVVALRESGGAEREATVTLLARGPHLRLLSVRHAPAAAVKGRSLRARARYPGVSSPIPGGSLSLIRALYSA